ncbi:ethanolamine ammonia-lyase reactivating factor EutA [Deltaproteobacteria bacterium OttesenSCG-928-M10]|nr:ethanolamine ammonia-lyase reactivating factor EutA [Deltaproteobacteria bacterium OttesenSCG-928-M10]
MSEYLLSVGIDLGTTTTQLIFSRLEMENTASATSIPRIQIVDKEIIYRSEIYFTPLLSRAVIDANAVRDLVEKEYKRAGISPSDLSAGAVIITGETARKENSEAVLRTLSGLAGDFVVATAGSDLESIIAGRGAGTAVMSKTTYGKPLVNLDIGGGTTNIAVFQEGDPLDTSCLDIGGRQLIIDPSSLKLTYVAEKMAELARRMNLKLIEGERAAMDDLTRLCDRLAMVMAESLGLAPATSELDLFVTAHPLRQKWTFAGLTFSGGVADFIYNDYAPRNPFPYGDIGPLLGHAVSRCQALRQVEFLAPQETIRATVVGAGSNTMEISGSTIAISDQSVLPVKNIPILKMAEEDEADDFKYFASRLAEKVSWFKEEGSDDHYQRVALAFRGVLDPSFEKVKEICAKVIEGMSDYLRTNDLLVLALDRDMAKSLGYALMNALPNKKIISLDSVKVENGDYIDIGSPLANGRVVPIVVKTLVFGR